MIHDQRAALVALRNCLDWIDDIRGIVTAVPAGCELDRSAYVHWGVVNEEESAIVMSDGRLAGIEW
ncbi:MAG: hypothetical protein HC805_08635 [Alkalinema sp. RL_2_19]|nr:hypothetical protein [Alkalinema sp. RL_2_19]